MLRLLTRTLCPAVLPLLNLVNSPSQQDQPFVASEVVPVRVLGGPADDRGEPFGVCGDPAGDVSSESPLTFGKVFTVFPRVTAISTPRINQLISQVWGFPAVENSAEFRKVYASGRDVLRYEHFVFRIGNYFKLLKEN